MPIDENDISIIRDQLSSLVTSIDSRIDARFSQVISSLGSTNSSIANLREEVRNISIKASPVTGGGSTARRGRDPGLPISPGALPGGSVPPAFVPFPQGGGAGSGGGGGGGGGGGASGGGAGSLLPGGILNEDFISKVRGAVSDVRTRGGGFSPSDITGLAERLKGSSEYITRARNLKEPDTQAEANVRQLLESFGGREGLDDIKTELNTILASIERRREEGNLTPGDSEEMVTLTNTIQNLIPALNQLGNTVEDSGRSTAKGLAGGIASIVGALSVQQYLMMQFVRQPYQYETLPALGAMGSTGMMGDVLSGAFGAQESVLQSYREFGVTGAASLGAGLGFAVAGPLGAVAFGLMGAGLGIMNKDFIAEALGGKMADGAFQAELGRRILDPQRLSSEFLLPTMQARVNLGLDGREEPSARILQNFASEGARSLGYDAVVVGQLIGAGLSSMRPDLAPRDDDAARTFIDTLAELEGFGVSREAGIGLLSTISAAGSEDFRESLARLAFATSEDGEITNYTMNVLVPALSKVVESRAIQNISRNSDLVERESAGLLAFFRNSDTNLGRMLGANPEAMSRIFDMLGQVQETAINDPALMLFLNRMGVSFADVIGGDARALLEPMGLFSNYADYDASGQINLESMASISSLMGFLQATGIGVTSGTLNIAAEMFSAMEQSRRGGFEFTGYDDYMERMRSESPEYQLTEAFSQFADRMTAIAGSEGAGVTRNIVDETTTFFELMTQNVNSIMELQNGVRSILADSSVISRSVAEAGIKILETLSRVSGVDIDTTSLRRSLLLNTPIQDGGVVRDSLGSYQLETLETMSSTQLEALTKRVRDTGSVFLNDDTRSIGPIGPFSGFSTRIVYGHQYDEENNAQLQYLRGSSSLLGQGIDSLSTQQTFEQYRAAFEAYNQNYGDNDFDVNVFGVGYFLPDKVKSLGIDLDFYKAGMLSSIYNQYLNINDSQEIPNFNKLIEPLRVAWGFATGGYTGTGTRLDPVGVVHGGEYVISDNNVNGNFQTLQRMQAGEKLDESSPFSVDAPRDSIRVTLEFSNTNPEEIINAAKMSARQMLREERLL